MTFTETILYTNTGGILGTLISVYFSGFLIRMFKKYWPEKLTLHRKARKVFSKQNRRLVKLKTRYGLPGIVILSPVILSIPLGSFLVVKYYGISKVNILLLITGQVFWSFVYAILYTQFKTWVT
jgi:hypothetical protein